MKPNRPVAALALLAVLAALLAAPARAAQVESEGSKLIDRGSRSESFEGEADTVKLDHPILDYVVPMIDRVRVKLEARLD